MDILPVAANTDLCLASKRKSRSIRSIVTSHELLLVTYTEQMVDKYCEWFQDDYLCRMTATETASVENAFYIWTTDPEKVMFIVLDRKQHDVDGKFDMVSAMIGDVNLVISNAQQGSENSIVEGSDNENEEPHPNHLPNEAEVMLMIAEPGFRSRGFGSQVLHLMLRYGYEELGVRSFKAHISSENTPSLRLFRAAGFRQTDYKEVFSEYSFELILDAAAESSLLEKTNALGYSLSIEPERDFSTVLSHDL